MKARIALHLVLLGVLTVAGCASSGGNTDPIETAFDPDAPTSDRVRAIEAVWADAKAGELPRDLTRERLTDVAWAYGEMEPIRRAAVEALLSDRTPEGDADSRRTFLAMLPTEPSPALAALYIEAIDQRDWPEAETALVRSLSRPLRGVETSERPELTLLRERAGSIEQIVFDVFMAAAPGGGPRDEELIARRTREDAWDLLNRLQPDRAAVASMIRQAAAEAPDPWLDALVRAHRDFAVVPMTGTELDWLVLLASPDHSAWWDAAKAAAESLAQDDRAALALRHLEPLRWAREHRPHWADASRSELISTLQSRLDGRRTHKRTADQTRTDRGNDEDLEDWLDRLTRLDLLSILVVDEAIQTEQVQRTVFKEVRADLEDSRSEYGGIIHADDDGALRARAFRPRSSERGGNTVYIAPPDLYTQGADAIAVWHIHARELTGRAYAGPSRPDLLQAADSGRTSLVFSSLGPGRIDADIYLPNGAAIDLGEIREASR